MSNDDIKLKETNFASKLPFAFAYNYLTDLTNNRIEE